MDYQNKDSLLNLINVRRGHDSKRYKNRRREAIHGTGPMLTCGDDYTTGEWCIALK